MSFNKKELSIMKRSISTTISAYILMKSKTSNTDEILELKEQIHEHKELYLKIEDLLSAQNTQESIE